MRAKGKPNVINIYHILWLPDLAGYKTLVVFTVWEDKFCTDTTSIGSEIMQGISLHFLKNVHLLRTLNVMTSVCLMHIVFKFKAISFLGARSIPETHKTWFTGCSSWKSHNPATCISLGMQIGRSVKTPAVRTPAPHQLAGNTVGSKTTWMCKEQQHFKINMCCAKLHGVIPFRMARTSAGSEAFCPAGREAPKRAWCALDLSLSEPQGSIYS